MKAQFLVLIGTIVVAGAATLAGSPRATSCVARCGENDNTEGSCQCNALCVDFSDCCSDYEAVCMTCSDRCGDAYVSSAPCHCNDQCSDFGNCCSDYDDLCVGGSGVTDAQIKALTEELYGLDSNNVAPAITIDLGGLTVSGGTTDQAPNPLFVSAPTLSADTYVLFEALRDNYQPDTSIDEDDSVAEQAEVTAFLDAVLATPLMQRLDQFMTDNLLLTGTLRANIEEIWFTFYSRSGATLGSSGFEHSFVGELDEGDVSGFHNWVSFLREEEAGNVNYMGYVEYTDLGEAGYVLTSVFTWYGAQKAIGGSFVGTSVEYELALYTLCFFARPNSLCPVQTNGVGYNVQTYELLSGGKTLVGSAYPAVS